MKQNYSSITLDKAGQKFEECFWRSCHHCPDCWEPLHLSLTSLATESPLTSFASLSYTSVLEQVAGSSGSLATGLRLQISAHVGWVAPMARVYLSHTDNLKMYDIHMSPVEEKSPPTSPTLLLTFPLHPSLNFRRISDTAPMVCVVPPLLPH